MERLVLICIVLAVGRLQTASSITESAHKDVSSTAGHIEIDSDLMHFQEFILSDNWDSIGCIWNGTGSGDPYKMAVECAQYTEAECHPDPEENGLRERRCIWRDRVHGNAPLEEERSRGEWTQREAVYLEGPSTRKCA